MSSYLTCLNRLPVAQNKDATDASDATLRDKKKILVTVGRQEN